MTLKPIFNNLDRQLSKVWNLFQSPGCHQLSNFAERRICISREFTQEVLAHSLMQVQEWSGCTRLLLQPALIDGLQYLMNSSAGNPKDHCNLSLGFSVIAQPRCQGMTFVH
jgi:hypothetical protein